jgi:hypothetical protein
MRYSSFAKQLCVLFVFLLLLPTTHPILPPNSASAGLVRSGVTAAFHPVPVTGVAMGGPPTPQPPSTEYLIIAPNDSWVRSFANWKTAKGVPTHVANVTWIQANFPINGATIRDKAEQIWTYIHQVYTSGMIPTLRWVLLVGNNATIPSRYVYLPDGYEWTGLSRITKPTDFYYCAMGDSNWDDDNDGRWGECYTWNVSGPAVDEIGDWTPDLYVGRIPFSDQGNVTTILAQVVEYERYPTNFSATGWDSFLLAGAISNYDEEWNAWLDGDYTDEAELKDWINTTAPGYVPSYYRLFRFYESRQYFWNYTCTHGFQALNATAVASGINLFSPALINLAGHGTPIDMQRKYENTGYPYGSYFTQSTQGVNVNVTGVAIGDPDNDMYNEIVYTLGAKNTAGEVMNGTVWLCDGPDFTAQWLIWDLWHNPLTGPTWATCVDIGDVWNNGTIAVVVGTHRGEIIIFTYLGNHQWSAVGVNIEYGDPVLCIEVGNADNAYEPGGPPGSNTDIAWGHASGKVMIATCFGTPPPPAIFVALVWVAPGAVYSIDVGNPNDDPWGEITVGTGYLGAGGNDGDCYMLQYIPPGPWLLFVVDKNLGDIVYGLDTGNAANDGWNKVVVGLGDGAIYMYEANLFLGGTDAGTKKIVSNPGDNGGLVRCLRVGHVDDNDLPSTLVWDKFSIIAGNQLGGIRKYHANNMTGFIDWYPIQLNSAGPMVTAIDVGELSYTTGETTSDKEIAAGTEFFGLGTSSITWYEWPWSIWSNMISAAQARSLTTDIPALIYADSCLTGAYDYSQECLAEAFLRNDSIGFIGAMRDSWYRLGPMANSMAYGENRYMDYAFWQLFFSGTTSYRPGATLYESKANYITSFQGFINGTSQSDWETYHRKNLLTYALFGDPEIDVFTNNPAALVVTYPAIYFRNQFASVHVGTISGASLSGATVCLRDPAGGYYQVAQTNASGYAVFNLTAAANTLLGLTVTNHNYIPYEGAIRVKESLGVSGITLYYDPVTLLLNVTGVMAYCPTHGYLNNTMALVHTYTIYSGATNLTSGQLVWHVLSSTWRSTNIPCNSLPDGTYTVYCYFTDTDGMGYAVSSFNKVTAGTPLSFLPLLLILIVIILCVIIVLLLLRRRGNRRRIQPQRSRPSK